MYGSRRRLIAVFIAALTALPLGMAFEEPAVAAQTVRSASCLAFGIDAPSSYVCVESTDPYYTHHVEIYKAVDSQYYLYARVDLETKCVHIIGKRGKNDYAYCGLTRGSIHFS